MTSLSARRTGALIVIERREGLKTYIENGVPLDSAVSYDLLVTLFAPGTPLHDGAVILSGERVAAAGCFLPLSLKEGLSKRFGTRHRAAIGITEETDALADRRLRGARHDLASRATASLVEDLDGKSLRDLLLREFATGGLITAPWPIRPRSLRNLGSKILALAIAHPGLVRASRPDGGNGSRNGAIASPSRS